MYFRIIINLLLIFLLASAQLSFISGLPAPYNNLNLVLVVLIFVLSLVNLRFALWWSIGVGLILDIFSFSIFGVSLLSLSLSVLLVNLLLVNYFTNRSLYSFFALTVFFTAFHEIVVNFISFILNSIVSKAEFNIFNMNFWSNLMFQTALNLVSVIVIFYFINLFSNKLKPAFLSKSQLN